MLLEIVLQDVMRLRASQLPEDAGPLAHPIRPESYIKMDNFYTSTVYEKGDLQPLPQPVDSGACYALK